VERKLAAILMADVVGYSRLMGVDEAGTLTALRSLRTEIMEPLVAKHHGRVVIDGSVPCARPGYPSDRPNG
jgi:adenylate cyclase